MKKLRLKIVFGVFISATLVFSLTIVLFGIATHYNLNRRADSITDLINKNNGRLPHVSEQNVSNDDLYMYSYDEESPYRLRYFVVSVKDGTVKTVDVEHIAAIDNDKAEDMAYRVMRNNLTVGSYEKFRFRVDEAAGRVIFLDCSGESMTLSLLSSIIVLIALGFIIMITVVFYFLSNRIVHPFEENARMQKQFITDASHELKTPVAIIAANAEVLAYKDGENEWINNITSQVARISELVNELLMLNRLEEIETVSDIEPVRLSDIVNQTVNDFEEIFNRKEVSVVRKVEPDVVLNGNAVQLGRLVSVLTENASKYAQEGGEVRVTLVKESRYTIFTVFNTCETDSDADYKHLFDRFYRPDSSRTSKTGGHGIGLSIAKRIVTLHNGSIEAAPTDGGLQFTVKLSNKLKS